MTVKQLYLELFPIYNAVVLTEESQQLLRSKFEGVHRKKFGHHITTEFRPPSRPNDEGKEVTIKVIGYAKDENGEAVVAIPSGVSYKSRIPHITISCAEGVVPKYSNELLEGGFQPLDKPFTLKGTITAIFPKQ